MLYEVTRRLLSVPALLLRRDTSRHAEILVPRHENAVLRRQPKSPVRYKPADLWGSINCVGKHDSFYAARPYLCRRPFTNMGDQIDGQGNREDSASSLLSPARSPLHGRLEVLLRLPGEYLLRLPGSRNPGIAGNYRARLPCVDRAHRGTRHERVCTMWGAKSRPAAVTWPSVHGLERS